MDTSIYTSPCSILPGKSAHGKTRNSRLAVVHAQIESQASQVSHLNLTLESLASQDFAVNNTNQSTLHHHTFSSTRFHQSYNSSLRIVSPSARRKNAAAHGRRTARRPSHATRIPGRLLGLTSFPTPSHHPTVTNHLPTPIPSVNIHLRFSQRQECSVSHRPPSHGLQFAFTSSFIFPAAHQQHTSSLTHQDSQVSQALRSFTRANHLVTLSFPEPSREKPRRASCLVASALLRRTCRIECALSEHVLVISSLSSRFVLALSHQSLLA